MPTTTTTISIINKQCTDLVKIDVTQEVHWHGVLTKSSVAFECTCRLNRGVGTPNCESQTAYGAVKHRKSLPTTPAPALLPLLLLLVPKEDAKETFEQSILLKHPDVLIACPTM